MIFKFPAAKVAVLLAAASVVAIGLGATQANAEVKRKSVDQRQYDDRGRPYYGPNGPNVVYQQGPTRIYVTKRSWLDAGTEVLPGERKFRTMHFRRRSAIHRLRAKTSIARSIASRSTRRRMAELRPASRCIEGRVALRSPDGRSAIRGPA